jgi:hypothetical protein
MQKQYNKKNKYQRDKWYSDTTTLLNIIIVLSIIDLVGWYLRWVS